MAVNQISRLAADEGSDGCAGNSVGQECQQVAGVVLGLAGLATVDRRAVEKARAIMLLARARELAGGRVGSHEAAVRQDPSFAVAGVHVEQRASFTDKRVSARLVVEWQELLPDELGEDIEALKALLFVTDQARLLLVAGHLSLRRAPLDSVLEEILSVLEVGRLVVSTELLFFDLLDCALMRTLVAALSVGPVALLAPLHLLDVRVIVKRVTLGLALRAGVRVALFAAVASRASDGRSR